MVEHHLSPHRPAWGWRHDVGLALAVAAVQTAGTVLAAHHQADRRAFDVLAVMLLIAGPVMLAFRRRAPVAVLVGVFGVTLAYDVVGYPRGPIFLALIVAFFGAALAGHRLAAGATLVAGYAGFLWLAHLPDRKPRPPLGQAVGLGAWLLVLGTASEVVRVRRERAAQARRTIEEE